MHALRKRFWAEIDMDAARDNFFAVRRMLGEGTRLCCVVKANAYGHGAIYLARLYEELGAELFAVSNIEEAMQLRRGGIKRPVLILGYTPSECAALLAENEISQAVFSYEYAKMLDESARAAGVRVSVHIKVDTGMGRLGFIYKPCGADGRSADTVEQIVHACELDALSPDGIFTHFALADGGAEGEEYTRAQLEYFKRLVGELKDRGLSFSLCHAANSASILDFPEYGLDMVRAGIVLYGVSPSEDIRARIGLRPVMALRAVVSFVKDIEKGDAISYGSRFVAERRMRIATVPVGYADGYLRSNGEGRTYMLVHGKRAPIVGRICMDQLMLDVTDIEGVAMGDTVTVIGKDGDEEITVQMIAERNGTIPYEIMCAVGERVPRFYLSNGRVLYVRDNIIEDI